MRALILALLLLPVAAEAGPIAATNQGTSTATVHITADLNSSTAVVITGRNALDPFSGNAGNGSATASGDVNFGSVNLATGPATAHPGTRFIIHPNDHSLTLVTEINIHSTLTGTDTGVVQIGGNAPAAPSTAHWACNVSTDVWGGGAAFAPNNTLSTPIPCQSLTLAGELDTPADLVLHIPTTEPATQVSATFNVTVLPTP